MEYTLTSEFAAKKNHTFIYYDDLKIPGFGRLLNNGIWTGLVGEVVEGRAAMAPTLGPSKYRMEVLDMARSSHIEPTVMCLRSPEAHRRWHALVAL